jgi:hypothetical protein
MTLRKYSISAIVRAIRAGGYLEMNVYKPPIIFNITHSITIMADGCTNFRRFLSGKNGPNLRRNIQLNDLSPSKWFRARWPTHAQAMADCLATTCALRSSGAAKTCCA